MPQQPSLLAARGSETTNLQLAKQSSNALTHHEGDDDDDEEDDEDDDDEDADGTTNLPVCNADGAVRL